MSKLSEQVREFHEAFGVPAPTKPAVPEADRVRLRLKLIAEEFTELLEACGCPISVHDIDIDVLISQSIGLQGTVAPVDMVEVADALADLDYVVEGSRLEFGIDGDPIAAEVHRSNIAKKGATKNEHGKIMKPPGWTPPNIEDELRKQGWVP